MPAAIVLLWIVSGPVMLACLIAILSDAGLLAWLDDSRFMAWFERYLWTPPRDFVRGKWLPRAIERRRAARVRGERKA